ncbi:MAG: OsmC family protein [Candidatus Lokiarchaeota archaeon]|nr:OsmC family protein [Candidatus Lokiarchaeota archaeon]
MSENEYKSKVNIELESNMIFKWDLGILMEKTLFIDELHSKNEEMLGPSASKLLASAILGCLSASFVFCLKKRNLTLDDFKGEAEIIVGKNEKNLLRVKELNVHLTPTSSDPEVLKRIEQCKKFFEQYCTITESVRAGITVNVDFK